MKQHITIEQLRETTDLSKLNELSRNDNRRSYDPFDLSKRLNIGKMIEIIDERFSDLSDRLEIFKNDLDEWCIAVTINNEFIVLGHEDELCDVLWSGIKEILRKIED